MPRADRRPRENRDLGKRGVRRVESPVQLRFRELPGLHFRHVLALLAILRQSELKFVAFLKQKKEDSDEEPWADMKMLLLIDPLSVWQGLLAPVCAECSFFLAGHSFCTVRVWSLVFRITYLACCGVQKQGREAAIKASEWRYFACQRTGENWRGVRLPREVFAGSHDWRPCPVSRFPRLTQAMFPAGTARTRPVPRSSCRNR